MSLEERLSLKKSPKVTRGRAEVLRKMEGRESGLSSQCEALEAKGAGMGRIPELNLDRTAGETEFTSPEEGEFFLLRAIDWL